MGQGLCHPMSVSEDWTRRGLQARLRAQGHDQKWRITCAKYLPLAMPFYTHVGGRLPHISLGLHAVLATQAPWTQAWGLTAWECPEQQPTPSRVESQGIVTTCDRMDVLWMNVLSASVDAQGLPNGLLTCIAT